MCTQKLDLGRDLSFLRAMSGDGCWDDLFPYMRFTLAARVAIEVMDGGATDAIKLCSADASCLFCSAHVLRRTSGTRAVAFWLSPYPALPAKCCSVPRARVLSSLCLLRHLRIPTPCARGPKDWMAARASQELPDTSRMPTKQKSKGLKGDRRADGRYVRSEGADLLRLSSSALSGRA